MHLDLSPQTRLMILAPHPDDEALAAGGIIQQALSLGANLRVIFVTNGDNNPWPQRWFERRWFINAEGRARWGATRKEEARRSINVLGLSISDVTFFGLPDQGILRLVKSGEPESQGLFDREFNNWKPNLLLVPDKGDKHPDHRGTFELTMKSVHRMRPPTPAVCSYIIHRGLFQDRRQSIVLPLSLEQQQTKLRAIQCHESQLLLSRRRFTAYATPIEAFYPVYNNFAATR